MAFELLYTSAPRGLFPGSSGLCTVKATRGIPLQLREMLESLSHYRHHYAPNHPQAARNPINYSSVVATVGTKRWRIISIIRDCGVDHTQRSNFLAHHIALGPSEASACCPTLLFAKPGAFVESWDFRVEDLPNSLVAPTGFELPRVCNAWQNVTGDAGWAGAVAERLETKSKVYIAYSTGMQTLPLVSEVYGLLSEQQQCEITFSTFYSSGTRAECLLRCIVAGSDEHREIRDNGAFVIDLTKGSGELDDGPLVHKARGIGFPIIEPLSHPPPIPNDSPSSHGVEDSAGDITLAPPVAPPPIDISSGRTNRRTQGRPDNPPVNRSRSAAIWALPVGILCGIGLSFALLTIVALLAPLPFLALMNSLTPQRIARKEMSKVETNNGHSTNVSSKTDLAKHKDGDTPSSTDHPESTNKPRTVENRPELSAYDPDLPSRFEALSIENMGVVETNKQLAKKLEMESEGRQSDNIMFKENLKRINDEFAEYKKLHPVQQPQVQPDVFPPPTVTEPRISGSSWNLVAA